jgi:hypothetical protein
MNLFAEILTSDAISVEDVDDINVLMRLLESHTQPEVAFAPLSFADIERTVRGALLSVCRDTEDSRGTPKRGKIVAMGTFSYFHTLREMTGVFGNVVGLAEYRKTAAARLVTRELVRSCKVMNIERGFLRADPPVFEQWRKVAEAHGNKLERIDDLFGWYYMYH